MQSRAPSISRWAVISHGDAARRLAHLHPCTHHRLGAAYSVSPDRGSALRLSKINAILPADGTASFSLIAQLRRGTEPAEVPAVRDMSLSLHWCSTPGSHRRVLVRGRFRTRLEGEDRRPAKQGFLRPVCLFSCASDVKPDRQREAQADTWESLLDRSSGSRPRCQQEQPRWGENRMNRDIGKPKRTPTHDFRP